MKTRYSKEEVVSLGRSLYADRIRREVEDGNFGRFLIIDVDTGEYEHANDEDGVLISSERLHARHTDAHLYIMRIGYPAATFIGMVPQLGQPHDRPR